MVLTLAHTDQGYSKSKSHEVKVLSFPPEAQTLETLSRSVTALYLDGERLITMPEGQRFAMVSSFKPQGENREKAFGPLTSTQRLQVVKEESPIPDWRGIALNEDRILFLDGSEFSWIEAENKGMSEVLRRSIPWDRIRPPRDSRGEPTTIETKQLRLQIKKAWDRVLGLKATGVAAIPASWVGTKGKHTYAIALRIKEFQLVIMECSSKEPSSCMLARQCYLEGVPDLTAEAIAGIGVSTKQKLILIGDRKARMIHIFRFDSCFHVPRVRQLHLPDKIKELNNIHVDHEDRLWLSTKSPDDYLNASVYYWPSHQW